MQERIEAEIGLLRRRYPDLEYRLDGQWVRIPKYPLSAGWSSAETDAAFQIPVGFPGTPPYGIYVASGTNFNGARPDNYTEPAPSQPPFGGNWGIFSWAPDDGAWRPTVDPSTGSNLLNWVIGFAQRFREGK